jgi:peptidoglycan lytic transglycosylase
MMKIEEAKVSQARSHKATKRLCAAVFFVFLGVPFMAGPALAQSSEEGRAHFYSDKFHGKKTASGRIYDKNGLTAAHKKHPFGTKLQVTNLESGKTAVVTVTDRMARKSRIVIDVSRRAAVELGFVKAGTARVKVEVVQ